MATADIHNSYTQTVGVAPSRLKTVTVSKNLFNRRNEPTACEIVLASSSFWSAIITVTAYGFRCGDVC